MIGLLKEFKEFVTRGNAFDLAIGVIVGGAVGPVVTSMVSDIIMPLISLIGGQPNFDNLYLPLTVKGAEALKSSLEAGKLMGLAEAKEIGAVMPYGKFLSALVSFLFLMLAVFVLIKAVNTLRRLTPAPAPAPAPATPPPPPPQEVLLTEIRDLLKQR